MVSESVSSKETVSFLDKPWKKYKRGVALTSAASLLLLVFSIPVIPWILVRDAGALASHIKMDAASLRGGYNLFNLLSFVQQSKIGALGFTAMLLFLLVAAATVLHLISLAKVLGAKQQGLLLLNQFIFTQAAMVFSFVAAAGTIFYVSFANGHFGMQGFAVSPAVFVMLPVSLTGYVMTKQMEKRERVLNREHGFLEEVRRNWVLFLFLIPCFGYFIINNYLPMAGIYFAFTQFNFRDGLFNSPFIGFKNFEFLFNADLLKLTRNTVLYNLVFIVVGNAMQIFFAILVSRVTVSWFKKTSQTLIFMPYFVSYVILRVLVYNLFEYEFGVINSYLASGGLERIDFYNTPVYWPFIITLFFLWKSLGYGMVVYLATIMGISTEYYDAAKVDGANVFQEIRFITLPLLKPTFIILLLYALGGIMKGQFELFYQMVGNNGVLFNITDILDTYVYRITTTQPLSMGLGTAAGLFQSVFGFVIIIVANLIIKRKNAEYALF